jgi:hypothetical protein
MPLETKDIFDALKMQPVETKEDLVKAVEEAGWIQEEQIFKDDKLGERIFGRAFGTSTTNVAKTFRKMGVEITGADLKNPIEKVVETGLTRLNEAFEKKQSEIENNAKLSNDERIVAAEKARDEYKQKAKELEEVVKTKATEFEGLLKTKEQEVKGIRLSTIKSETQRGLNYLPDLDPYKKKGWLTEMDEKYKIDIEEDGTSYIVAADSGQRIKSTQHAGTFLTPTEVYQMEAAKAGIINIAPNGGKPVTKAAPVLAGGKKPEAGAPAAGSGFAGRAAGRVVAPGAIPQ